MEKQLQIKEGQSQWSNMTVTCRRFWQSRRLLASLLILVVVCFKSSAAIKAGDVSLDVNSTTTISLASAYQSTLKRSTISTYRWSTTSSNVSIISQSAYSCTIKALSAGTAQVDYFCSYWFDGYYRTMEFYYKVTIKGYEPLTITPTSITMKVGETYTVKATQNGTIGGVYFTSDNSSVASVNTGSNSGYTTSGTVIANSIGTTYIYAKNMKGDVSDPCKVTVKPVEPKSIIIYGTTITEGEYGNITVDVSPSDASYTLTWSSSDTDIVTVVNSSGRVYGKKPGTARITAKVDGTSLSDWCTVTVKAKQVVATSLSVGEPIKMGIGDNYQLKPVFSPNNATVSLKYDSDKKDVVTVSSSGLIKAEGVGKTVVTVTDEVSKLKASVDVAVFLPGDVNSDLTVDVSDIASIITVMADSVGADPVSARAADVNDDGVVDVADIATVISIMAARAWTLMQEEQTE